tara:strand:- start:1000 stop:1674 length:675 start_codon:yes stop_codon:yes gene_type:complete
MKKSIIIFGKGPSLLKCKKEFVDKFDDIAICNYPVLNTFFYNLIKNRTITYHFANCGTFDERYTDKINKLLNIQYIINTNKGINNYKNYLENKSKFTKQNIRVFMEQYFKTNYNLDPSTGTMCLYFILLTNKYNKISLVGFDNFKKGEQVYYYKPEEYNKNIKYLINKNIITKNGVFNIQSLHDSNKTQQFYEDIFKKYENIKFELITNIKFNLNLDNLIIIDK